MNYHEFLKQIIEDGCEAVMRDYRDDTDRREGSLEGFEVCEGLLPSELAGKLFDAQQRCKRARGSDTYRRERSRAVQIEWVCNVVSALLMNVGEPVITPPTARGALKAADILGV